ncbi:MAG: orotate phosphoribosyltransferase [Thermoproteota archaeon]|nr:orotate phosphoribosyltransferase [Thermoproteota archaeon]
MSLPPKDFVFQFASFLLKSNSLRFGVFTLASGKQSAYYIDLRVLPSFPGYFRLGIHALKDLVVEKVGQFDIFASVPTSGLIFGSALAYEMSKPFIYVRKDPKSYGTNKMIEGFLNSGSKVVIVDDVATTGSSLSSAVEIIRTNGGIVEDVVALVDRHEGAQDKLEEMGVKLSAVIGINDIVNALHNAGLIDRNALESVLKQMVTRGEYEID